MKWNKAAEEDSLCKTEDQMWPGFVVFILSYFFWEFVTFECLFVIKK